MCGIVGIIDQDRSSNQIQEALNWMLEPIVHRGPDDAGSYVNGSAGIAIRRLSIIDVEGGHQPIANEDSTVQVVCNGEIYNYKELRADLDRRGHHFRTASDTEVIAHLYEDLGTRCFRRLRGMFAIAIWDANEQRLVLARDRLGKKPLFYAETPGQFLFSSEIKSVLAVRPDLAELNQDALVPYFRFGFVPQPTTFYRQINKFPAGAVGTVDRDGLRVEPFWSLELGGATTNGNAAGWLARLDETLLESVRLRLRSDVPLGVFLSGGLDSSAIVAYAHKAGLHPLKTFTVGFDRPEWDESKDAERIAKHFQTEHQRLQLSSEELEHGLADTVTTLVRHFDEPFGDPSSLPTYHISRLARGHVTVILSGDGGDELFGGYTSYVGATFAERYRALPGAARSAVAGAAGAGGRLLPEPWHYKAQRIEKVLRDSELPLASSYLSKTSIYRDDEIYRLLSPEITSTSESLASGQFLSDDLWQIFLSDRDLVNRLCYVDLRSYMLDDILVKVDRMSMANSLEVRSPLLDHHVVELAVNMPSALKVRGFSTKLLLRQLLRQYLPAGAVRKRKQGFSVPLRDWLRGGLAEMVEDYLHSSQGLPWSIFDRSYVNELLTEHRHGTTDHSRKIWLLLNYAAWNEEYLSK